jgi:hypothetical protein
MSEQSIFKHSETEKAVTDITIEMMGKDIELKMSRQARRQLDTMTVPLIIEMELYFSCLLRKQIRVRQIQDSGEKELEQSEFFAKLSDKLHISFRPVMTKSCSVSSCEGERPPLSDFPIQKPRSYIPRWLNLDFKKGKWCGDFGY